MFDNVFRSIKEQLFAPLALKVGRGVHPSLISIVAFGVGLLSAVLVWQQQYLWGLLLWLLNRLLDGLDGTFARANGQQSDLGAYLDIVFDFTIYALIPIGLVLGRPTPAGYACLACLLGSFYLNAASWMYLSAILKKRKQGAKTRGELTAVTMPIGLINGTETVIFYALFMLLPQYLGFLFAAMSILVVITVGQHLVWAIRHL